MLERDLASRVRELVLKTCERYEIKVIRRISACEKRYWGQHFWARGYLCVTAGELKKVMLLEYLSHYFEPKPHDGFNVEP